MTATTSSIVTLTFQDLVDFDESNPKKELIDQIGEAFGPNGLGILAVSGVPDFDERRQRLLPLASRLPGLPDLESCVHEASMYSTGWSHGKEKLGASGEPDVAKGSYYGNPLAEDLVSSLIERSRQDNENNPDQADSVAKHWNEKALAHPEFYAPNVWPASLPELQTAFCEMGQTLHRTGCLLARVCDAYCKQRGVRTEFARLLSRSLNAKGRLLHYFDAPKSAGASDAMWCGWHNDHGSLTGLVPGMYMKDGVPVACPDSEAGLYIQPRGSSQSVRVTTPHCAFQIGETSQLQSSGLLQATPHAVMPSRVGGFTRESFALFLEPEFDELLEAPSGTVLSEESSPGIKDNTNSIPTLVPLDKRYKPGQTFGDFHLATVTAFSVA